MSDDVTAVVEYLRRYAVEKNRARLDECADVVEALAGELRLANENLRLREESQIPMIPRGAQARLDALEADLRHAEIAATGRSRRSAMTYAPRWPAGTSRYARSRAIRHQKPGSPRRPRARWRKRDERANRRGSDERESRLRRGDGLATRLRLHESGLRRGALRAASLDALDNLRLGSPA